MLSIEAAKNLEDLFQIKAAIMRQKLEDVGGRNGVMEILDLSLDAYKRKDYQKSLKIITPLMEVLKNHPFVSNDAITFVSISDRMEWVLYLHYYQTSSNQQIKNISAVCPVDWIYRQYALTSLDLGDYDGARKAVNEAIKWNPTSAKCRILFAMLSSAEGHWDELLQETISAMKCAYRSNDLVHCFRFLKDYFINKKLYKEAVYCSFLRARFSSSHDVLCDILDDMVALVNRTDFDYKSVTDDDMAETCNKYGFSTSFYPEVLTVAQRSYEEMYLAGKAEKANYFAQIMADLKTEQEKRDSFSLRQLVERHRNIVS